MAAKQAEISVLHVDDQPGFGEMAAEFIERQDERITVKPVLSPSEGLDHLSENSFDCIVSDFDMPNQNGIEFLETVREDDPELPFILYTGKGSEEVASDAISAGVTDYLQKGTGSSQYELLANRIINVVEQQRARQEVAKTEQRLRTIADNTNDVLWKFNDDWSELLFINSAYEEIWGRSVEELRTQPRSFLDGIHPKDRDLVRDAMQQLSAGESVDIEYRVNTDEDFGRWVWVEGEPVFDDVGEVECVVGFARDITNRKQQSERFEALIEHSVDVTTVIDEMGTITYESPSVKHILGYEPGQLIGETAFEYIHPDDRDRIVALFSQLMDKSESEIERATYRFEHADGRWVWLETGGRFDSESPIDGYVLNSRDISEQKERQEELKRHRDLLEYTEELAKTGGWEADAETGQQRWTKGTYAIHGLDPDGDFDPSVDSGIDFFHPDDRPEITRAVERCLEGEPYQVELRLITDDDRLLWIRASGDAITEDGEVVKIRGAIQDITDLKQQEEEIQAKNDR